MSYDWTSVSKNPDSEEVRSSLYEMIHEARLGKTNDFMSILKSFVEGKRVLDIGVVGQGITYIESDFWKHKFIRDLSSSVMGIDIVDKEVESLQKRGFNVKCVDATSDVDLGLRFDRIVIGDVIEHVDNPVNLLRFARRHLEDGGNILVTTPNPYWFKYVWQTLRVKTIVPNAEHVSWITPSLAYEMGRRAGLALEGYWLESPRGRNIINKVMCRMLDLLFGDTEVFASAFYFVYGHKKPGNNK